MMKTEQFAELRSDQFKIDYPLKILIYNNLCPREIPKSQVDNFSGNPKGIYLRQTTNWLRVLSDEKLLKAWAASRSKINSLNPVSGSWTEVGVVAGFLVGASMIECLYVKIAEIVSDKRDLQSPQYVRCIGKTRNQFPIYPLP